MKVIFLDIDGVLNNYNYAMSVYNKKVEAQGAQGSAHSVINDCYDHFDPVSVQVLNEILEETGAKIVISSAWRIVNTIDELREHFTKQNIKNFDIIDVTPSHSKVITNMGRGGEILEWITNNKLPLDEFVIIDDSDDMNPYMDKLVQTTFDDGLRPEHKHLILQQLGVTGNE